MTYNYGPLASKAVALIAKYGKAVQLELDASPAPLDGAKPWRGPDLTTPTHVTPKGLVTSFTKNEINGDSIRVTDMKLLIAGQDATIAAISMDLVKFAQVDGVNYGADNLVPVRPGDTTLLYVLRLRQG